jgi:urease accessory protein
MQLSDSFFPTGAYAMSSGLEVLAKKKKMDADKLRVLVQVYLERQIGPADCCALGNAHDAAKKSDLAGVIEADTALFSIKLVREVRNASARSGAQLVRCAGEFAKDRTLTAYAKAIKEGRATGVYPVSLAVSCAALGVQKQKAGSILAYSFCVSVAGAALRLGIIDHVAAQKMLHELKPAIAYAVRDNVRRPLAGMWQFAPAIDIAQMEHERMDSKMFIT